jgi:hypothetical protein
MSRAFPFLLLVSAMCAQPPDVDQALRDRITKFYQAHVDRKLIRQADQYVAEDSKDFFYEANKPTYLEFHIDKITYSDDFTKAKAIVNCKTYFMVPGFADKPMMVPIPSTWKVENGQWFWYFDQKRGRETPFGLLKPAEGGGPASLPSVNSGVDIQTLWKSVRADKSSVQLSADRESSSEVTISSKMPGAISLRLDYAKIPGLEVALDREELKAGEQAKISLRFQAQDKPAAKTVEVRVIVQPTNQVIPIAVTIQ